MISSQRLRSVLLIAVAVLLCAAAKGQASSGAPAAIAAPSADTDEPQRHLKNGIFLASQKHYKAARLELQRADAIEPGNFAILFNLGQVDLRDGDNPHAELVLSEALKLNPQSPQTMYLLAQAYSNQSRPLDALDLLARARDLAPTNADILLLMAQIGVSQRYYEDAVPLLEKATQLDPKRPDIVTALGEAYFKSGRMDKAVSTLNELLPRYPSVTAYGYLGVAYTYLGRFDEARMNLQRGLKLAPTNNFCIFQLGYLAKLQGDSATAEKLFSEVLRSNPNQPNALLSLAGIRAEQKRYLDAVVLLKRYILIGDAPATGYYKLAMVEKSLHDDIASQRDLATFRELSTDTGHSAHPYDHLFDYIDERAQMTPERRLQQDLNSLAEQAKLHPNQPEVLYALAEAELKSGDADQTRRTVTDFDNQRPNDARTLTGFGVLLARYGLYDDAIKQFQLAIQSAPESDDARFDLANTYFRKASYSDALATAQQISERGRTDDSYSSLLADIYSHLGDFVHADSLYQSTITRNPDKDQAYLSLALLQMRENHIPAAAATLKRGHVRIPGSGKLAWGLGLSALLEGDIPAASGYLEKAVELLPEWPGTYATLGFLYYQTGQLDKAKEVLDRFKNSSTRGGLDVDRIAQTLASAPITGQNERNTLTVSQRLQVFQLAVYLADKTL